MANDVNIASLHPVKVQRLSGSSLQRSGAASGSVSIGAVDTAICGALCRGSVCRGAHCHESTAIVHDSIVTRCRVLSGKLPHKQRIEFRRGSPPQGRALLAACRENGRAWAENEWPTPGPTSQRRHRRSGRRRSRTRRWTRSRTRATTTGAPLGLGVGVGYHYWRAPPCAAPAHASVHTCELSPYSLNALSVLAPWQELRRHTSTAPNFTPNARAAQPLTSGAVRRVLRHDPNPDPDPDAGTTRCPRAKARRQCRCRSRWSRARSQ